MIEFWKNILKMSVPVMVTVIFGIVLNNLIVSESILILGVKIVLYTIVYFILMWKFGMNDYEKEIVRKPIDKVLVKVRR